MATRDFSGEEVYGVLVNVGGFRHVRTTGDHLILRWDPPDDHEDTDPRGDGPGPRQPQYRYVP